RSVRPGFARPDGCRTPTPTSRSLTSWLPPPTWIRWTSGAHDCGQIINPDGLKNQLEGCVPILKFPQVPEIVIDLIDRPTEKPRAAGEPAASVIPSAISNAVFDATGMRLRSIPYILAKVKAAMQGS